MTFIFFDLETSDKEPIGQILNYSFLRTTNAFEEEAELSGNIRISPLQIPSPEALLANRIKVQEHQQESSLSEPEALLEIARFIASSVEVRREPAYLVGFNSSRFDVPFLRTSFIRNGINPYFSGKLKYKDVLHWVRHLYIAKDAFPVCRDTKDPTRLSLRLETVANAFGVLDGKQSHHSRDDVLLTIQLCRVLEKLFNCSLTDFSAYQVASAQDSGFSIAPNYELSSEAKVLSRPYVLLNENYRSALWVDVERYAAGEGRRAIQWVNKNAGQLLLQAGDLSAELQLASGRAREEFKNITPDNFFPRSSCDIEQDIYRLDMQKISLLERYVWSAEKDAIAKSADPDLKALALRYWLAYGSRGEGAVWDSHFTAYAEYRYGKSQESETAVTPRLQICKTIEALSDGGEESGITHHRSLEELLLLSRQLLASKESSEDREVLSQLITHIENSKVAMYLRKVSEKQRAMAVA